MRPTLRGFLGFSLAAALVACGSSSNPTVPDSAASGGSGGSGGSPPATGGSGGSPPATGGSGGGISADASATGGSSTPDAAASVDGASVDGAAAPDGPPAATGSAKIVLAAGGGNGGDGMAATMAAMSNPYGVTTDPMTGELYVSEMSGQKVRKIDNAGIITTVVGAGAKAPNDMKMSSPHDALFQPGTRNLFIANTFAGQVWRYDVVADKVELFAGKGTQLGAGAGTVYCLGFSPDGATLYFTAGANIQVIDIATKTAKPAINFGAGVLAVDSKGVIWAANGRNANALQMIDTTGKVIAAAGSMGLNGPKRIAIDNQDNVIIADTEAAYIRKFDVTTKMLSIVAGNGKVGKGTLDGPPESAQVARPHGVFVAKNGDIYIGDSENSRVLRITH